MGRQKIWWVKKDYFLQKKVNRAKCHVPKYEKLEILSQWLKEVIRKFAG